MTAKEGNDIKDGNDSNNGDNGEDWGWQQIAMMVTIAKMDNSATKQNRDNSATNPKKQCNKTKQG